MGGSPRTPRAARTDNVAGVFVYRARTLRRRAAYISAAEGQHQHQHRHQQQQHHRGTNNNISSDSNQRVA